MYYKRYNESVLSKVKPATAIGLRQFTVIDPKDLISYRLISLIFSVSVIENRSILISSEHW